MSPLPDQLNDRERDKFDLNSEFKTAVRVIADIMGGSPGPSSYSSWRVTTMDVTDVAAPLPAVALPNRKHISIFNKSSTVGDIVFTGPDSSVTADSVTGITSGDEIFPREVCRVNLKDTGIVYGIAESGKTIQVKVIEYA